MFQLREAIDIISAYWLCLSLTVIWKISLLLLRRGLSTWRWHVGEVISTSIVLFVSWVTTQTSAKEDLVVSLSFTRGGGISFVFSSKAQWEKQFFVKGKKAVFCGMKRLKQLFRKSKKREWVFPASFRLHITAGDTLLLILTILWKVISNFVPDPRALHPHAHSIPLCAGFFVFS